MKFKAIFRQILQLLFYTQGNYTGRRMKVGEIKAYDNDTDADKSVYGAISYNFINMSSTFVMFHLFKI